LSNRPEQIVEAAKIIGRSKLKRSVFEAIYHHKKRSKSVDDIIGITGLSRMQVLQNGGHLAKSGLAIQHKEKVGICYKQIPFFQTNKAKILALAGNSAKISKVATKRIPQTYASNSVVFEKQAKRSPVVKRTRRKLHSARLKIAFLSTNPVEEAALRTDIEARNVQRVLRQAIYRDQVDLRHIPAAEWADLLDALNEFAPNIIHFSGHGGDSAVLFDNQKVYDDGGVELNFELINRFIKATKSPPVLLVFNACSTFEGAEVFLESVGAVVAMTATIDDAAAAFFSSRFYSALGNGQSIKDSLEQGKASLVAENFSDADLPSLISTGDHCDHSFF
ncbi:MAG: CHAT domain-containing protein, partial [Pseudomonadota bacterium]